MPPTAKAVAWGVGVATSFPRTAIRRTTCALGTTYLRRAGPLRQLAAAQVAAYNAGPHRVDQWLPRTVIHASACRYAGLDRAHSINETRNYVQRVLGVVIYRARAASTPTLLAQWTHSPSAFRLGWFPLVIREWRGGDPRSSALPAGIVHRATSKRWHIRSARSACRGAIIGRGLSGRSRTCATRRRPACTIWRHLRSIASAPGDRDRHEFRRIAQHGIAAVQRCSVQWC